MKHAPPVSRAAYRFSGSCNTCRLYNKTAAVYRPHDRADAIFATPYELFVTNNKKWFRSYKNILPWCSH